MLVRITHGPAAVVVSVCMPQGWVWGWEMAGRGGKDGLCV